MNIESMEDWFDLLHLLDEADYTLHQTQFDIISPQGLHAVFIAPGGRSLEIVTHSKAVHDAILAFMS